MVTTLNDFSLGLFIWQILALVSVILVFFLLLKIYRKISKFLDLKIKILEKKLNSDDEQHLPIYREIEISSFLGIVHKGFPHYLSITYLVRGLKQLFVLMELAVNATSGVMVWQILTLVFVILVAYFALKYYITDNADI